MALRKGPLEFMMGLARDYGDIAHYHLAGQDMFLLSHPDLVKDVLVTNASKFFKGRGFEKAKRLFGEGLLTSEGEFHTRQRRLVQPAFHRQRITFFGDLISAYSRRAGRNWSDGVAVDVHQEMTQLTLAIAGKTLFDADVETEAEELGKALREALGLFDTVMNPFMQWLEKLPWGRSRRFQQARARLDATIYRIIRERRASREDRGDVLSMLLQAQDAEGGTGSMTDEQLRDECMTVFLAGHETIANALTWTWYLLSRHPEIYAKVQAEADGIPENRLPSAGDLPQLAYTEQVFAESMRMYPPGWMMDRRAVEPYSAGGYDFPVDSIMVMSPYVLHHDTRFFPDPFRFDPGRWTAEGRASRPRYCYLPFGAGPRGCIGEAFAWMEAVLIISTIARRWSFELEPGHRVEPKAAVILRPRYGMRMIARARPARESVR
jgi:cytochrome P450